MSLIKIAKSNYTLKELKDLRVELTRKEFNEIMDRKAIWHHGPNNEETPAVWKAQDVKKSIKEAGRNKTPEIKYLYITNTHRAFATSPTLKGAISRFHNFIKGTA